ncbi:TrfB transcriptional repressor protein [compost metagenome]
MSKGAVSQAVHRVWSVFMRQNIPAGFERVSAVLPEHQAFIVKKWAENAQAKNNGSKT